MKWGRLAKTKKAAPAAPVGSEYAFRLTVMAQFEFINWRQRFAYLKSALIGKPVVGPIKVVFALPTIVDINKAVSRALQEQKSPSGLTIVR